MPDYFEMYNSLENLIVARALDSNQARRAAGKARLEGRDPVEAAAKFPHEDTLVWEISEVLYQLISCRVPEVEARARNIFALIEQHRSPAGKDAAATAAGGGGSAPPTPPPPSFTTLESRRRWWQFWK